MESGMKLQNIIKLGGIQYRYRMIQLGFLLAHIECSNFAFS